MKVMIVRYQSKKNTLWLSIELQTCASRNAHHRGQNSKLNSDATLPMVNELYTTRTVDTWLYYINHAVTYLFFA